MQKTEQTPTQSPKDADDLAEAYTDGRIVGDQLVACLRPEGLEHINGLPDFMGAVANAINQQPNDRTGSACMHGIVNSFVRELIHLNRKAYNQERELRVLKDELH